MEGPLVGFSYLDFEAGFLKVFPIPLGKIDWRVARSGRRVEPRYWIQSHLNLT